MEPEHWGTANGPANVRDTVGRCRAEGRQGTLQAAPHIEEVRGKNINGEMWHRRSAPSTHSSAVQLRPQTKTQDQLDDLQNTGFLPTQNASISKPDINLFIKKERSWLGFIPYVAIVSISKRATNKPPNCVYIQRQKMKCLRNRWWKNLLFQWIWLILFSGSATCFLPQGWDVLEMTPKYVWRVSLCTDNTTSGPSDNFGLGISIIEHSCFSFILNRVHPPPYNSNYCSSIRFANSLTVCCVLNPYQWLCCWYSKVFCSVVFSVLLCWPGHGSHAPLREASGSQEAR